MRVVFMARKNRPNIWLLLLISKPPFLSLYSCLLLLTKLCSFKFSNMKKNNKDIFNIL